MQHPLQMQPRLPSTSRSCRVTGQDPLPSSFKVTHAHTPHPQLCTHPLCPFPPHKHTECDNIIAAAVAGVLTSGDNNHLQRLTLCGAFVETWSGWRTKSHGGEAGPTWRCPAPRNLTCSPLHASVCVYCVYRQENPQGRRHCAVQRAPTLQQYHPPQPAV